MREFGSRPSTQSTHKRYHFWLVAYDDGKPYLIYGGITEDEARRKGLEMLGGLDFQIKRYPTSNLPTASSYFHGSRLEQTKSPREAMRRVGHDKSLERLKKKRLDRATRRNTERNIGGQ